MRIISCPIWQTPANEISTESGRDGFHINSPRAGGHYFISGTAAAMIVGLDEQTKIALTSWLVDERGQGDVCPELSSNTLNQIIMLRLQLSVHQRAHKLLQYVGDKSDLLGTVVEFSAHDKSEAPETAYELLAWTASRQISEVIALAEYCSEEGWIKYKVRKPTGSPIDTIHEMILRPPGYERIGKS